MSKERELLERVLETDDGTSEFYIDGKLEWDIKELLAQPEQNKPAAIMPNGVCVSNVYDAYEEGRKSVMSEQEPVAWMLIDKETGARIPKAYKPEHGVNKDRWELYPLYSSPPKQPEENIKYKDAVPNSIISRYEAELEQALKDTIDEERIGQIMINCISYN